MAAVKRLQLLRRISHSSSSFRRHTLFPNPPISPPPPPYNHTTTPSFIRHFSSSNDQNINPDDIHFDEFSSVLTQPDSLQLGSDALLNVSLVGTGVYDESILPIRVLISILDSYHHLTGVPWWMVIASSTVIMRLTLFPFVVLQLHKLKRIGELFPKLPPPFPPPLSGRSIKKQFKLFLKEKKAAGCPSLWWFPAPLFVQAPTFLLFITTIRRMSLEHHPGFDCGGTLWLHNLTEYSNGAFGPVFPLMIAFLHYAIVQVSFEKSSIGQMPGLLGQLAKYYKYYLDFLTLPILLATFYVPQGSLVYWFTNSSLSLVQQLTLKHPTVRMKLGLPPLKEASLATTSNKELGVSGETENILLEEKEKLVSVKDLSPLELVNGSLIYLSKGNKDKALQLLRLALQKDPEHGRAMIVMGQILLNDGDPTEALEYFERVVSRISLSGNPRDNEDVHLLIMSCQLAGAAFAKQNNFEKSISYLQRAANLEEPKDPKTKVLYYDGLVLLCSALYNVGKKTEAAACIRRAIAFDSRYDYLLEQIGLDEDEFVDDPTRSRRGKDEFVDDLTNSRRRDY